ncbi:MAG: hypothetical protein WCK49_08385 [Myxococcaceae bacterium]
MLKITSLSALILFVIGCGEPLPSQDQIQKVDPLINKYLKPVVLDGCDMKRFGDSNDGGYLLCAEFLNGISAAYSYGIEGRDNLGCEVANTLNITVHQYDPFDIRRPACNNGKTVFHEEGIAHKAFVDDDHRKFDTLENHIRANQDTGKQILVKMDVEGAEWESLLNASEATLENIQQLTLELHWLYKEENFAVIENTLKKLSQHFYVVHIHTNNHRCGRGGRFLSDTFEVTYVNKNLPGLIVKDEVAPLPHPLDAACNHRYLKCDLSGDLFN